jgi:hypothetical protein
MLHAGFAAELAEAVAAGRRDEAEADRRARDVRDGRPRPRISSRSFEQLLSIAGAVALLSIVIIGPIGTALVAAAVAFGIALRMPALPRPQRAEVHPRSTVPATPEAVDPWRVWRMVEPDPGYRGRRAA